MNRKRVLRNRLKVMLLSSTIFSATCHGAPLVSLLGTGVLAGFQGQGFKASSTLAFGGGLLVEVMQLGPSHLEVGGIYLPRRWSNNSANYAQVPVLFTYWLSRNIGFGGGLYYSFGLGNITQNAETKTFEEGGLTKNEGGALAAVRLSLPLTEFTIGLEGRYSTGLTNVSSVSGITSKFDDLQILFGIRFGGGESDF